MFATSVVLKTHIRIIHEKVFKYECDICKKGFELISNLNSHKRTVHVIACDRDYKFKCEICLKGFERVIPYKYTCVRNIKMKSSKLFLCFRVL